MKVVVAERQRRLGLPPRQAECAMPELPDLTVYQERLTERIVGARLDDIRIASPFVLRSVSPPVADARGRMVQGVRRLAKQLVMELEERLFVVIHLMIAGRLQWRDAGAAVPKRVGLAAFDFSTGTLIFTEAGKKRRAALRLAAGDAALTALNPGGLEVLDIDLATFAKRLRGSRHTLKRTLTDQRVFAGIGNAYSDEILLRARLSPFKRPADMDAAEVERLYHACRGILTEWTRILRTKAGTGFPTQVTAFHDEMAAHGKFRQPCPVCGAPIQRIVHAENESNYCARCQTGGRVLRDRSLSKLLKETWPKRVEELEGR